MTGCVVCFGWCNFLQIMITYEHLGISQEENEEKAAGNEQIDAPEGEDDSGKLSYQFPMTRCGGDNNDKIKLEFSLTDATRIHIKCGDFG